jgi:hypothetical protein
LWLISHDTYSLGLEFIPGSRLLPALSPEAVANAVGNRTLRIIGDSHSKQLFNFLKDCLTNCKHHSDEGGRDQDYFRLGDPEFLKDISHEKLSSLGFDNDLIKTFHEWLEPVGNCLIVQSSARLEYDGVCLCAASR